ncbi:hypothetical protein H1R20_g15069, partial [Candolleomyces eurysporus]
MLLEIGFIDESGKEHIENIAAGNKKAVDAALKKGDIAGLKTEAAAAFSVGNWIEHVNSRPTK